MSLNIKHLQQLDEFRWQLSSSFKPGMLVPGIIYMKEDMLAHIMSEQVLNQIANVACLPGIVKSSLAMPDVHWGYGFPIGGVAAMRLEGGIISPGGVGFDINCGVRLIKTEIELKDISTRLENIVDNLFNNIPSGLGCCSQIRLNPVELDRVLEKGATWAIEQGYGRDLDIELTEEKGTMIDAATDSVSKRAKERGASQLGTLGSGNHFVELAVVDEIYDPVAAYAMGITRTGQVMCWIHTGSRGLGHQIADDYIKVMLNAMPGYGISVPDRQLACSPVNSPEGLDYLAAMRCAANYAWANRQIITHWARQTICQTLEIGMQSAGMDLVCDVAHNIAKIENHIVNKHTEQLCVHRKGATRAFGANHPDLPKRYKKIGQPVLIPGDMGRYSYIMTGSQTALEETFGSTCHGAGRLKSRMAAKKIVDGRIFYRSLWERGIIVKAHSYSALAEEASPAYKDIEDVVKVAHGAGLSHKVARTRPIGVIKG